MAILHIFNPEHDLALASNLSNFTAPHAGRQLHCDLGFLPAIWAKDDDFVLVDNIETAKRDYARVMHRDFDGFVEKQSLRHLDTIDRITPWGWDLALRSFLQRQHVELSLLPLDDEISLIRQLSHRGEALQLLKQLQGDGIVGQMRMADLDVAVEQELNYWPHLVVKAPWSSSGRGIRFIDGILTENNRRWIRNVIAQQGEVMLEPYYNKVKDFGMEFRIDEVGQVQYLGLSLFHTSNGAYTGNIIATEEQKREMISRYISLDLLDTVQSKICHVLTQRFGSSYYGPFGVDMMVVRGEQQEGFLLHPCVEINLRRTMGHVALSERLVDMTRKDGFMRVMQITYDGTYKLKIQKR